MRKSLFGLVLLPLALGLAAPAAFAQPDKAGTSEQGPGFGHHRGKHGGKHVRKHRGERLEKLGLSADQQAKLKTAREAMFTSGKALHESMKTRMDAVKAALLKPTPNRSEILSLASEVGKVQTQLQTLHVDFMLQARAILTPEQFATFVEMAPGMGGMGGKHGMRGGRHGKRGGRGGEGWHKGGRGGHGARGAAGPDAAPELDDAE